MKTMRKPIYMLCLATLFLVAGCQTRPKLIQALDAKADTTTDALDTVCNSDSTLYGVCVEGTSTSTLRLQTDEGSIQSFSIAGRDSALLGGLNEGDYLALLATPGPRGTPVVTRCINLTTLIGPWCQQSADSIGNISFTLQDGGTILSTASSKTSLRYTGWMIFNGRLLLFGKNKTSKGSMQNFTDTFSIRRLEAGSLELKGAHRNWLLHRP